jgi:glycosyltransferase involved in cell wall biosynthesis
MKIIQLLPELNEGGVERGVVDLNRELILRGYESIVISAGGKLASQINLDGGTHIALDICSKNIFTFWSRKNKLQKIIKYLKPDILHARSRVPAWLVHYANKTLKIPFVTTVHGFNSVSFYSEVMTYGDEVICVSGAIKDYIQKNYNTNENKIIVIPRGIDLVKFNPNNLDLNFIDNFSQEYNLINKYIVTSVGRITQLKDIETFIKAIGKAKQNIPNIIGLIVGGVRDDKQEYFNSLKALVKSLNLEENIIFTGSQSKVAEIYNISNVVISSSKKPETFGRSAAEALSMNTPVIATNHGGILDIVKQNKTGWLFEIEDSNELSNCIIESKDHKLVNLRKFVEERFTLDNMVDKTIEVYNKCK